MPKLKRLRTIAFHAQHGHCFYCGLPMWMSSPHELKILGLRPRTALPLRCTAEHLVARRDGGNTTVGNIAAACWLCNTRRHKRKAELTPDTFRALVQKRLTNGKWHPPAIVRLRLVRRWPTM